MYEARGTTGAAPHWRRGVIVWVMSIHVDETVWRLLNYLPAQYEAMVPHLVGTASQVHGTMLMGSPALDPNGAMFQERVDWSLTCLL